MDLAWATPEQRTFITDLSSKGLDLILYKDPHRPKDDSLLVYDRKQFKQAMNIPLDAGDNYLHRRYIELADAMTMVNPKINSEWVQRKAISAEANAANIYQTIEAHFPPHDNLASIMLEQIQRTRTVLDEIEAHIKEAQQCQTTRSPPNKRSDSHGKPSPNC